MDFSNINSINDLIKENEKAKNEGDLIVNLCKPVFQEEPEVGMQVAITILTELLALHSSVMIKAIEDGESNVAANWAMDCGRIDDIITTLKNISV